MRIPAAALLLLVVTATRAAKRKNVLYILADVRICVTSNGGKRFSSCKKLRDRVHARPPSYSQHLSLSRFNRPPLPRRPHILPITRTPLPITRLPPSSQDMRADWGAYGLPVHTPHLDALAATSLRFQHAYCQLSVCSPSRQSFMTSKRPDTNQVSRAGVCVYTPPYASVRYHGVRVASIRTSVCFDTHLRSLHTGHYCSTLHSSTHTHTALTLTLLRARYTPLHSRSGTSSTPTRSPPRRRRVTFATTGTFPSASARPSTRTAGHGTRTSTYYLRTYNKYFTSRRREYTS